jgi:hypothetical protein
MLSNARSLQFPRNGVVGIRVVPIDLELRSTMEGEKKCGTQAMKKCFQRAFGPVKDI